MVVELLGVSDLGRAGIGAVAGGLAASVITLAVNAYRDRTRQRRADAAALQLVIFEIGNAQRAAQSIVNRNEAATSFPVKAWEDGRLRLAQFLDPDAWLLAAAVYDAVHGLNWRYQFDKDHRSEPQETRPPPALNGDDLVGVCTRIDAAATVALPALRDLVRYDAAV